MREDTIPLMFFARANRYGNRCALRHKSGGRYRDISWSEFEGKVKDLAFGLITLGLKPGEKVALLSENRPEWAYSDLAVLSLGCADVPLYPTDVPYQMEYIIRDSDSVIAIVSTAGQLDKILSVSARLPSLRKIIVMDPDGRAKRPDIMSFADLLEAGSAAAADARMDFESRLRSLKKEDLASIVYTSGTTGQAKGVCLTHDNFLSNCRSSLDVLPFNENDVCLSFLPLSHVFERMAGYYFTLTIGGTIAYAENMESVGRNLKEVRPTYACAPPRFYEKLHAGIMEKASQGPPSKQKAFERALNTAIEYARAKLNNLEAGPALWLKYHFAKIFIFRRINEAVGGRIRFFISGSAPLSKELAEFFYSVGIFIFEGYGLTETSPVVTVNTFRALRHGSVGRPIKDVEVKTASDGEILIKGPSVMKGYYKNEKATAESIDPEGWLHTGDIGYFDADGFLYITDRKKDIIITAGGKNIAPQNVEKLIKSDSYIQEVVVHGDRRPYLTALIVPDFNAMKGLALRLGIPYTSVPELIRHPRVQEYLWKRIEEKQNELANYEKIKKFRLLDRGLTIEDGEITPTLKVKRRVVAEKYKEVFDEMYSSRG
ncbi:MAG TPA: long-chain fatty acid--CoA ligase [Candidatus Omnitrophota bacterium]|nr:long-chain fatty acid--CoA ligase [Candidatus Omnitrophota bacterium]